MTSRLILVVLFALASSAFLTGSADGASGYDAKVALHVKAAAAKGVTACGDYKPDIPCSDYTVESDLGTVKYVYLVMAQSDSTGFLGLTCGVDYDGEVGQGVDVYQWILCTDGFEFPNSGPNGPWPAAGGGNVMTFNIANGCPGNEYGSDGIHTVFGVFITYAYGPDTFSITENRNVQGSPDYQYANCVGQSQDLQSRFPEVKFSPGATDPGHNPCLDGPVGCRTRGDSNFGNVTIGDYKDEDLTIINVFESGHITGEVSVDCEGFEIISGGGPYDLAPGETRVVTIRFTPTAPGSYECLVDAGDPCRTLFYKGRGVGCSVPSSVIFPVTALGSSSEKSFTIKNGYNPGGPVLSGTMTESCDDFEIVSGGSYNLAPGESQTVVVRFTPSSVGIQSCQMDAASLCGSIRLRGSGGTPSGVTPKVLLHAAPVDLLEVCDSAVPTIPCSQYVTSAPTGAASFVYLVVGKADPVLGLDTVTSGIEYDPAPGQGVDVIEWYSCADTQLPTNGPNGMWPASGGGCFLQWNACQTTVIEPDGIHAVAAVLRLRLQSGRDAHYSRSNWNRGRTARGHLLSFGRPRFPGREPIHH